MPQHVWSINQTAPPKLHLPHPTPKLASIRNPCLFRGMCDLEAGIRQRVAFLFTTMTIRLIASTCARCADRDNTIRCFYQDSAQPIRLCEQYRRAYSAKLFSIPLKYSFLLVRNDFESMGFIMGDGIHLQNTDFNWMLYGRKGQSKDAGVCFDAVLDPRRAKSGCTRSAAVRFSQGTHRSDTGLGSKGAAQAAMCCA